jgi:hypothetical protein
MMRINPTTDGRTNSLSLRRHKYPSRSIPGPIDRLSPLSFRSDASDLAVEHVLVFPERGNVVLSLVTGAGTATFLMPPSLASEVGEGLYSSTGDRSYVCFRR